MAGCARSAHGFTV